MHWWVDRTASGKTATAAAASSKKQALVCHSCWLCALLVCHSCWLCALLVCTMVATLVAISHYPAIRDMVRAFIQPHCFARFELHNLLQPTHAVGCMTYC